jgi:hypothetical protein
MMAVTASSRRRPGAHVAARWRDGRAGSALAALVLLACGAATAHAQQSQHAGTHGLWIRLHADSVTVHWLTDSIEGGALEVTRNGRSILRATTPAALEHRATFAAAGLDTVDLRFGSAAPAPQFDLRVGLRPPRRPVTEYVQPDSLFVLGDTHGSFDRVIVGLQAAGVIDENLDWSGGRSHLAFAGDLTDRGPDVLRLLWFVYTLEQQARAAGGRVHVLLGNHEIMVMLADLRYVHAKELDIASRHGIRYDEMFDPRASLLGRWLASKPGVVRLGDVLIAHGGVAPEYAAVSIQAFNDTLAHYLASTPRLDAEIDAPTAAADSAALLARHDFFWGARSVFWHRDYVRLATADADIDETLRRWNARLLVIGHTAVQQIQELYGGRVIAAHTPRLGAELLLIVSRDGQLERYRISAPGRSERF